MSQYPIAVFVGWLIDQYGPSLCSFVAALMFTSGYFAFAWEVDAISSNVSRSSQTAFYRLSFYFLLIGLGTVFSYEFDSCQPPISLIGLPLLNFQVLLISFCCI